MKRHVFIAVALFIILLSMQETKAIAEPENDGKAEGLKIVMTSLDITDKTLNMTYEIRNISQQDVWMCDNVNVNNWFDYEVFLSEDDRTLIVSRRTGVPTSVKWYISPTSKYKCLPSGEKLSESLLFSLPVQCRTTYGNRLPKESNIKYVKNITVEVGYYIGDLSQMFFNMFVEAERDDLDKLAKINDYSSILGFNGLCENVRQRNEEALIPYTYQEFKGECVVSATIDIQKVPCKQISPMAEFETIDLTPCNRILIEYEPSILEYFYPYQNQQSFLSEEEIEYLRSETTVVIEDISDINDFVYEIKQSQQTLGGVASNNSKAKVFCYRNDKLTKSFAVYDNLSIDTEQGHRIKYFKSLKSLRKFTPQIQPFELRMCCVANLRNLWYRLQYYDRKVRTQAQYWRDFHDGILHSPSPYDRLDEPNDVLENQLKSTLFSKDKMKKEHDTKLQKEKEKLAELIGVLKPVYPERYHWCDYMDHAFASTSNKNELYDLKNKSHVCMGLSKDQSIYAMNSNCRYNSPGDMVLLFETKAGWNQFGGPELFTFDNHDPKGGCVLLNDGTVKFIRSKK